MYQDVMCLKCKYVSDEDILNPKTKSKSNIDDFYKLVKVIKQLKDDFISKLSE